jgi:hypothetical protein
MYEDAGDILVPVRRLDDVLADQGLASVDFIKLDVEGSELEVLSGATRTLANAATFGVMFEFLISSRAYLPDTERRFGTLFDIHALLDGAGFELFDISTYRYARAALPQPFSYRYTDSNGKPYAGTSIRGQKTNGDALYCRDLVAVRDQATPSVARILKGACLLELFALEDCAMELLLHYREALAPRLDADRLADLLVPKVRGKAMPYSQYLATYATRKTFFMPAAGYRFPDHTVHTYDGVFVERVPYRPKAATRPLVGLTAVTIKQEWTLGTPATKASAGVDGIRVVSDRSQYAYQLASPMADVAPEVDYVLVYDITVVKGGFSVGVLDGESGQWTAQVTLTQGANAGRLYVVPPGAKAQVVLANCNVAAPAESDATIRTLDLFEAEYADA